MKNYFRIDFGALVEQLLPTMLRASITIAFVRAMISPITALYALFMRNREANLYHLSITPQVFSIEKALNDRFDISQRRIYLSKGLYYDESYLFKENEALDEYLYLDSEHKDSYLYTGDETGAGSVDFFVNVPADLLFDENEMSAYIGVYRPTRTFKIVKI